MSDVTSRTTTEQETMESAWEQAHAAPKPPPAPGNAAANPATAQQKVAASLAQQPWEPNLVDIEGDPQSPRSAIREGQGGTVAIDASGRRSGWGFSTGSQGSVFGGFDVKKRTPVLEPGVNPFEIYGYRNEGLGTDAADELKKKFDVPADLIVQPYFRQGRESFRAQEFRHAGGFYPGDDNPQGQGLQRAQAQHPENTADLEERRWAGNVLSSSGGYVQFYGSANPSKKSGLGAARYIHSRIDTANYLHKSRTVEGGQEQVNQVGSAYASNQAQARIKVKGDGDIGADVGSNSSAGVGYSSTFFPGERQASDWWLADGVLQNNLDDPEQKSRGQEFADLAELGFQLKGESLLPMLGDHSAQVFFRVPDADVNFGNRTPRQGQDVIAIPPDAREGEYVVNGDGETLQNPQPGATDYRTQTDRQADESLLDWAKRKWPFGKDDEYISVDNLSALMTQAASRAPHHMELAYATPEALADANRDKLHTIIDPTTGEQTQGFKVGEWVNTGLLQLEGEQGLFVDRDRLPEGFVNEDGSINTDAELPHWKDHLSPLGEESLSTPRRLQDVAELVRDTDGSLPPALGNTQDGYLRDVQAVAERVNQAAGREVVSLERPDDAARKAGEPFTTVPRAAYYESGRQYIEDMESYITAVRDIYRAADDAGVEIPQRMTDTVIPARDHADAAQGRLDWIAAHRERVISQIDQVKALERKSQGPDDRSSPSPRPTPSFDSFPIR